MEVLKELNLGAVEVDEVEKAEVEVAESKEKDVEWVTKTITDLCLLANDLQIKLKDVEESHTRELAAAR